MSKLLITLMLTSVLLTGCGHLRTDKVDFYYLGKAEVEVCEGDDCTKIETNGFTGWAAVDGLIALAAAWWLGLGS